jgi:uncharacterized cupredoxin-like copper-binding protein
MKAVVVGVVAVVLAVATAVFGYAIDDPAGADANPPQGPGLVTVDLGVKYSVFSFDELRVRPGTTVEFRVRNDDPIFHEFIVGDRGVHDKHRFGSEQAHPPVPGEVSVKPNDVGVTFFRFDQPGRYEFACHLPGHYEYGMKGFVIVE